MKEKYIILDVYDNYAISNYGKLKNIKTGKILKPQLNKQGYLQYGICQNGIKKTIRAHRLVALMFVENRFNYDVVNHIDGNKINNVYTNLEWVTNSENTIHAQKNDLKHDNKPIISIDLETGEETVYYSIGECATLIGTNRGSIHRVLTGKRNKHKGHSFRYYK